MSLSYVRDYYDVPAYRGGLVTVDGKDGRITSANESILVRFDDGTREPCHPKWRVTYHTCHEEVADRDGDLGPCDRHAVGHRIDPEYPGAGESPYPVCRKHHRPPFIAAELEEASNG